jgi:hypothetical protein
MVDPHPRSHLELTHQEQEGGQYSYERRPLTLGLETVTDEEHLQSARSEKYFMDIFFYLFKTHAEIFE